jgi:hypothetical protein
LSFSFIHKTLKINIYRNKNLSVFCMGVKLGGSHRGRNIGWRSMRRVCCGEYFVKWYEVPGAWKKLHNEKFNDSYSIKYHSSEKIDHKLRLNTECLKRSL